MPIKTFGFELEFFTKDSAGAYCLASPKLPHDSCGYLAEARGERHESPRSARHLLRTAVERLDIQARKEQLSIELAAHADIPKEFLRTCLRRFGKNASKACFAHGGSYCNTSPRAGLHVHFGTERSITGFEKYGDDKYRERTWTVVEPMNVPRIIWMLDDAFKKEIKAAKRVLGEYEPKDWGFEYRSLPADIDLDRVVTVLEAIKEEGL